MIDMEKELSKFGDKERLYLSHRISGIGPAKSFMITYGEFNPGQCKELESTPSVKKFFASAAIKMCKVGVITREETLKRLSDIVRSGNILDIIDISDENTVLIKDRSDLDAAQERCIKSVTPTKFGIKVEFHNPLDALKQICSMQGYDAPSETKVTIERLDDLARAKLDEELDKEY